MHRLSKVIHRAYLDSCCSMSSKGVLFADLLFNLCRCIIILAFLIVIHSISFNLAHLTAKTQTNILLFGTIVVEACCGGKSVISQGKVDVFFSVVLERCCV